MTWRELCLGFLKSSFSILYYKISILYYNISIFLNVTMLWFSLYSAFLLFCPVFDYISLILFPPRSVYTLLCPSHPLPFLSNIFFDPPPVPFPFLHNFCTSTQDELYISLFNFVFHLFLFLASLYVGISSCRDLYELVLNDNNALYIIIYLLLSGKKFYQIVYCFW